MSFSIGLNTIKSVYTIDKEILKAAKKSIQEIEIRASQFRRRIK